MIFTDLILPGRLNGKDLAAQARTLKPDIGVLFATGLSNTVASMAERDSSNKNYFLSYAP